MIGAFYPGQAYPAQGGLLPSAQDVGSAVFGVGTAFGSGQVSAASGGYRERRRKVVKVRRAPVPVAVEVKQRIHGKGYAAFGRGTAHGFGSTLLAVHGRGASVTGRWTAHAVGMSLLAVRGAGASAFAAMAKGAGRSRFVGSGEALAVGSVQSYGTGGHDGLALQRQREAEDLIFFYDVEAA